MSDPPFTVKALFDYTSDHEDDLTFSVGQIITVIAEEDADWYFGEYTDADGVKREGIFPRNFVERYEPAAPPRPARPSRAKKAPESAPPPPESIEESAPAQTQDEVAAPQIGDPGLASRTEAQPVSEGPTSPPAPAAEPSAPQPPPVTQPETPAPAPSAAPAAAPAAKASSPAIVDKPASSSFKDRIAAFNKASAPPPFPAPKGPTNSFVKKPYVPPPPSRDAYIPPPPRDLHPKPQRRDPEPAEPVNREPPVSEHSQPPPVEHTVDDEPKPTSLKDRIALLQKQQLEQAARMAELAQKKEKPKKPPKKRTEAPEATATIPGEGAGPERTETAEPAGDERATQEAAGNDVQKRAHLASPTQPARELLSDTNDADHSGAADTEDADETSTSREESDDRPRTGTRAKVPPSQEDEQDGDDQEEDDEEEEEIDPEIKRRMELRERMAKVSGGMGMMGVFGLPGGLPGMYAPKKSKHPAEPRKSTDEDNASGRAQSPPVPTVPLPGMNIPRPSVSSPKVEKEEEERPDQPITQLHSPEEVPDVEDVADPEPAARKSVDRAPPPPPPHGEPASTAEPYKSAEGDGDLDRAAPPPPLPLDSRPPPPVPVPATPPVPAPPVPDSRPVPPPPKSPTSGFESDDELSSQTRAMSLNAPGPESPEPAANNLDQPDSQPPPPSRRSSTFDTTSPKSPTSERRFSRGPPPIPGNLPPSSPPPQARPPPPPPPTGTLSRRATADAGGEEAEAETTATEYEADYDTDIAPGAKYKDALKAHDRESSVEEGAITDEPSRAVPEQRPPPPPPPASAPRAVPPPPPSQPPKRASVDLPRAAPPPVPAPREPTPEEIADHDDRDYDPYRYDAPRPNLPPPPPPPAQAPPPAQEEQEDDLYDPSPVQPRAAPPPPPSERASAFPPSSPPPPRPSSDAPSAPPSRHSVDVPRGFHGTRRSVDLPRSSGDLGYMASDVDLGQASLWWTQPNTPPPVFQNRKDLTFEIEESVSTKRGGKTLVTKDVYVLFADYSQTVVHVHFDARNPVDVALEQRHEPPPSKLRQDQLEAAHEQFGTKIREAISAVQNTVVGDGTPAALIHHLLTPLPDALGPVGTRAYGALVYANLANATVQQFDEIRPGDIVSFRNAKFQGHRGGLHQKYTAEVGKPDHVGVVADWDGTKKKIHAWEQGRESKKVKVESFRLGDLKSGECKVWRVMPRSWVGWEATK